MNRTKCKVAADVSLRFLKLFLFLAVWPSASRTVLTDNKNGDFHKTYKTFIRVVRLLRSVVGFTASFYVYRRLQTTAFIVQYTFDVFETRNVDRRSNLSLWRSRFFSFRYISTINPGWWLVGETRIECRFSRRHTL